MSRPSAVDNATGDIPNAGDNIYQLKTARFDGGGGGGSGMESRVTKLENNMTDIRIALARIEAKLDSKVDYKWLTVYALGIVAVLMRNEILTWLSSSTN